MPIIEFRAPMHVPARALWAFHTRPGGFARLCPTWQSVRVESAVGDFANLRVTLAIQQGPLKLRWIAQHENHVEGVCFTDRQLSGPFAHWVHTHTVRPITDTTSELTDHIEYRLPMGPLGALVMGKKIERDLRRMFAFRHERTRLDTLRHECFAHLPRLKIGITGSTGLIGRNLCAYLMNAGHAVVRLVRPGRANLAHDPGLPTEVREIDLSKPSPTLAAALTDLDAVIHLAGEPIAAGRWTPARLQAITDSRVRTTRTIAGALSTMPGRVRTFLVASGIAGYDTRGAKNPADERASYGAQTTLGEVARAWEAASNPARVHGRRVVNLRFGIVLAHTGGALPRLLAPFKLGLGGTLGDGPQRWSTISLDDTLGAIEHALHTESLDGAVNVVSPEPISARDFAKTLGGLVRRPAFVRVPAGLVRALAGGISDELLRDRAVVPTKLLESGFIFVHPTVESGLRMELGLVEPGEVTSGS